MDTKVCTKCNVEQSVDNYYVIKKTGYTYNYCKKCHYKKTKPVFQKWRKDNKKQWVNSIKKAVRKWTKKQIAGVYLIETDKGMYVGCSDHIPLRITQHKSKHQSYSLVSRGYKVLDWWLLEEIDDKELRFKREQHFIKVLKPELNLRAW
jgi:predicted GIY-YIG superfamily endonuclease